MYISHIPFINMNCGPIRLCYISTRIKDVDVCVCVREEYNLRLRLNRKPMRSSTHMHFCVTLNLFIFDWGPEKKLLAEENQLGGPKDTKIIHQYQCYFGRHDYASRFLCILCIEPLDPLFIPSPGLGAPCSWRSPRPSPSCWPDRGTSSWRRPCSPSSTSCVPGMACLGARGGSGGGEEKRSF